MLPVLFLEGGIMVFLFVCLFVFKYPPDIFNLVQGLGFFWFFVCFFKEAVTTFKIRKPPTFLYKNKWEAKFYLPMI